MSVFLLGAEPSVRPFDQQHTPVTKTDADTTEAQVYAKLIPGNTLGNNGSLRLGLRWALTPVAVARAMRVRYGGTEFYSTATSAGANNSARQLVLISNRNTPHAQLGILSGAAGGFGTSATGLLYGTVDTTQDQWLTVTAQWGAAGSGSNAITLESVLVELLKGV